MQLELTNVINVSVATAQTGVGAYNTSNLALFTDEVPAGSFGSLGYSIYLSPNQVATDFGSTSKTYAMANAVFSQQPNILAGNGYLVVILLRVETQLLTFSADPDAGHFVFNYGGHASAQINWDDAIGVVQTKIRAVTGLSQVNVTGSIASTLVNIEFAGVYGNIAISTITSDTLTTGGSALTPVTVTPSQVTAGETIGAAITRTATLVQYFGIMVDETMDVIGSVDFLAAAAIIQPLNKIGFFVSNVEADIQAGGMITLATAGTFTKTRCLYYDDSTDADCRAFCAAYAGIGLSVNFSGSNTTINMHLKTLVGVEPDPNITQTILNEAILAGADTYPSLQGVPKVFSSGANQYYDQIYNEQWLVGALQVAAFNYLAQSSTKVPQTEAGMDGFKGAIRAVCQQAVTNGYSAPGSWNSSTTFGNQADLLANVSQVGYYIYSLPVAQQSQVDRAARKAPLVQIALKEAGAIDSATIIVYINA